VLISSIRFNSNQYSLKNYSLIKVTGKDREAFFQGQTTNDLSLISNNEGQLTCRLNRVGKLQSYFFIAKFENYLYLLCPIELSSSIINDFEKYIIMEEVNLEVSEPEIWIHFNNFLVPADEKGDFFDLNFYGINSRIRFNKLQNVEQTSELELEEIRILNGWPNLGMDINNSQFINESYLNEIAISYKKGCFLGQETVSKIENNRGAAFYPMLLKLDHVENLEKYINQEFQINTDEGLKIAGKLNYQVKNMAQVILFRDYRVIGRKLTILFGAREVRVEVVKIPFYSNCSPEDIATELYHLGVDSYQKNNFKEAFEFLEKAIEFNSSFADAYESIGVMLGREERFSEAIEWMNKLQKINPNSVMAHTNKSLYYMRLGKITEAEEEKSFATLKSFAMFGQEASSKKQMAEELRKKEEETLRREKMFLQVLEIDEEDTIALYGMSDIFFQRKNFESAIINLNKVIEFDPKYSSAYLLLGKALESEGMLEKAKETYHKGVLVASRRGDMMPANEMQTRLNQLVMSSRLT
jgi:folate-binding protein YgfZ